MHDWKIEPLSASLQFPSIHVSTLDRIVGVVVRIASKILQGLIACRVDERQMPDLRGARRVRVQADVRQADSIDPIALRSPCPVDLISARNNNVFVVESLICYRAGRCARVAQTKPTVLLRK